MTTGNDVLDVKFPFRLFNNEEVTQKIEYSVADLSKKLSCLYHSTIDFLTIVQLWLFRIGNPEWQCCDGNGEVHV